MQRIINSIVCLFVCLFVPRNLRCLNSYDQDIWHVGPLNDRKPLRLISFEYFQWYGNRKLLKQSTFLYFLVNMQKGGGLVKMSADWSAKGESV